ncbi:MAG: PHP domain-containing protein [Deltaproteobacteria bacterium]|nr:PHP domain-containing protein [Deltaproteobacteria bacterium]
MHLHTCLSPCADWEMSPSKIIRQCKKKGLDIIAVCDHNSAENALAVMEAGKENGIWVLPGMEICSKEEVHILSVFEKIGHAFEMQAFVYEHLEGCNQPEIWGHQVVADKNDEVMAENSRLLIGAADLTLNEIVDKTHSLNGLSIASHIDRPSYSIMSQVGFIPPDLDLDGVEVSFPHSPEEIHEHISHLKNMTCITSSDAHFPGDIGKTKTLFSLAEASLNEIRLALHKKKGRRVKVFPHASLRPEVLERN